MNHNYRILSTAPLPHRLIEEAGSAGICIDAVSFIEVKLVASAQMEAAVAALKTRPATIAFTSANAVAAIAPYIKGYLPSWHIYCTGKATKKAIDQCLAGCTIAAIAGNAEKLATLMIADSIKDAVFFCSDRRMDTLPALLAAAGISVTEITAYHTIETPATVACQYDAILFFSPSGVTSYLGANTLPQGAALFAIGATTAAAVYERTGQQAVVSSQPAKESVVSAAIHYFQQKAYA